MDIFENLENLNVSEECFDDIMDITEKYITESSYARRYGRDTGRDIINAIGARVGSSPIKLSKDEAKYFKYDPSSHTEGTKYKKETVSRDIKAQELENKGDRRVPLGSEMANVITANEIKPIAKKLKETPKDSDEYKELENKFNKLRKRARFHLGRDIVSEECFDDIVNIVEDIFSQIEKVHGNSEKAKVLKNEAAKNRFKEEGDVINRKIEGINKKAFYQGKGKNPKQVENEYRRKEGAKISDRRYTNKNSKGEANTDIRRVQTDKGLDKEDREIRNADPISKSDDASKALQGRVERSGKESDYYRTDKSIKRNAAKKLQDYMKNHKNPEPQKDLSDKLVYSDKSHPFNTKRGRGDYETKENQAYRAVAAKEGSIPNKRFGEIDRDMQSVKYRPEVKSIARHMKKEGR